MYHSIHYLDSLRHLFGNPTALTSRHARYPSQPERAETKTITILDYADGLQASVMVNHHDASRATAATFRFLGTAGILSGTIGSMYDYPHGRTDTLAYARHGDALVDIPLTGLWIPDAFIGPMASVMPAIQTGTDPITSARDKVFCSGANIFMLGTSSHGWKVNFCKFTNETRNGLEDSSRNDGLKFVAAVNGACAGGGYELALACDEIILIDDRSSAVSLPEVPLLGVLPGTGGLTRVTDKRHVRHDLADLFCTSAEGVRGQRAKDWGLVDEIVRPAQFANRVRERALELAAASSRAPAERGIELPPLVRSV
jgi:hypothetical protein